MAFIYYVNVPHFLCARVYKPTTDFGLLSVLAWSVHACKRRTHLSKFSGMASTRHPPRERPRESFRLPSRFTACLPPYRFAPEISFITVRLCLLVSSGRPLTRFSPNGHVMKC